MSVADPMAISTVLQKERALVTGEELLAMGNIGPCELIEGEIILMSPAGEEHSIVEANIGSELRTFVRQHKLGKVGVGEVGVYTRRQPDSVRGADVIFISNERAAQRGSSGFLDVAPDLVVEIISPDDRWSEVMKKLGEYFAIGVRLAWVVDPETQSVYAFRSLTDMRRYEANDTLPGDDVLPGFSLPVAEVFAE